MKVLEEIRSKCKDQDIRDCEVKPIDYCYVQLHHITAVNSICEEFFWSGIDGENRTKFIYWTKLLEFFACNSRYFNIFQAAVDWLMFMI